MKKILERLGIKGSKRDEFADFFERTSSRDQKKVFKEVVKKVNADQKLVVERYNKKVSMQN